MLTDEEKSSIVAIFNKHINESLLVKRRFFNPTFEMIKCFDFTPLPAKLNHIWSDIFSLYNWQSAGNGKHVKPGKAFVETHNRLNSFTTKRNHKSIMDLEINKNRYVEIIYGAMTDDEPKDYYIDSVHVLTGSFFLDYMIPGKKSKEISMLLYELMTEFNDKYIIPFIKISL